MFKRLISFFLTTATLLTLFVGVTPANATVSSGRLLLDKTEFYEGESIYITASASGRNSWYAIVPDNNDAPFYGYGHIIRRKADGTRDDLRDYSDEFSDTITAPQTGRCAAFMGVKEDELLHLPAGKYWIVYMPASNQFNNGSSVTTRIQITIHSALTVEKTSFLYGEPIMVTPYGGGADWVGIIRKDVNTTLRWRYIETGMGNAATGSDGKGSGVAVDMRTAMLGSNSQYADIPPGEYTLFIAPNDSYVHQRYTMTEIDITVTSANPTAEFSATYTLTDKSTGLSDGYVTVNIPVENLGDIYTKPTHIILYWADDTDILGDYRYISVRKITGPTTTIEMPANGIIPENATRLLVYTYNSSGFSDEYFSISLPEDRTKTVPIGDPVATFQIVSDLHIEDDQNHPYNRNTVAMLEDIKTINPDSSGIFVVGDAVNLISEVQYSNLHAILENSGIDLPMFLSLGNHEFIFSKPRPGYTTDYQSQADLLIEFNNRYLPDDQKITGDDIYYDLWIADHHFIFLGSEHPYTPAYLSDAQLEFLDNALAENRDPSKPVFVLLHQGLYNTVAGCMPSQFWDGVVAGDANQEEYLSHQTGVIGNVGDSPYGKYDKPLRDILAKYPEAMMFSGHSHWDLSSEHNMYTPTSEQPNYLFNTASVGYLWSDVRYTGGELVGGSHGYYVKVYEDYIEFLGRDFSSKKWMPNATYRIPLTFSQNSGEIKSYCQCGGKLANADPKIHVCEDIQWKPWSDRTRLPSCGNYYLTSDVALSTQYLVSSELRIDLNGHTITHNVSDIDSSRVFVLSGGSLVITDSDASPGKITRNLGSLTTTQRAAVSNYGLLVTVDNVPNTGDFTLYGGILDASGMQTSGGAVANLNTAGAAVRIYGGTIYGATAKQVHGNDGGNGGALYSVGPVELYGGTVTGGVAEHKGGGIYLAGGNASLLLSANTVVQDNITANDANSNIYADESSQGITVTGTFTGNIGMQCETPRDGKAVAQADNTTIIRGEIHVDNAPLFRVVMTDNSLALTFPYNASVTKNDSTTFYSTLAEAIAAYDNESSIITLWKNNTEDVNFTKSVVLDLFGFDISGAVTATNSVYLMDSCTDDYTIEDEDGYGVITNNNDKLVAAEGYLKIVNEGIASYHRLNLDIDAVSVRPSAAGIYYRSQFGGDEIVGSVVDTYGIALNAGTGVDFSEGTYTALPGTQWLAGTDADGNSNNFSYGTILEGFLKTTNSDLTNQINAEIPVTGRAYVTLKDGTKVLGSCVSFTLRELFEGNDEIHGIDQNWTYLSAEEKSEVLTLYKKFIRVMKTWTIPSIIKAA